MNRKRIRLCFVVLALITMSLIFFFSSEGNHTSNNRSKGILENVEKIIPEQAKEYVSENIDDITYENSANYILRKIAHVSIYGLLGICIYIVFYTSQHKKVHCFIYSILICFLYACSDEYHQSFTGRQASFTDVLLDTSGAIIACLILTFVLHIWMERKKDTLLSPM